MASAASLVVEEEAVYSHDAKDTVYTDAHRHTQFAYHGMASQMPVAVYIHIYSMLQQIMVCNGKNCEVLLPFLFLFCFVCTIIEHILELE